MSSLCFSLPQRVRLPNFDKAANSNMSSTKMMMNSLDTISKQAQNLGQSVWDTINWELFMGKGDRDSKAVAENKRKISMQIMEEENQDIEFFVERYDEGSTKITQEDEPEYEEISLPDEESEFEEGTFADNSSDEQEYYSDYGEETDEELEKELPDATGAYSSSYNNSEYN